MAAQAPGPNPAEQGWASYNCQETPVDALIGWYQTNLVKTELHDITAEGANYIISCLRQQCQGGVAAGKTTSQAKVGIGVPSQPAAARLLGHVVV